MATILFFRVSRTRKLRTRGVFAVIRMVDTELVAVATLFVKATPRRSAGAICSTLWSDVSIRCGESEIILTYDIND